MPRPTRSIPLLAAMLAITSLALAGCGTRTEQTGESGMTSDTSTMAPPVAAGPASDAEIAAIVKTANDVDVEISKAAQGKSENADVKTFARMMVNDHTASNKDVDALAQKLEMQIQESRATNDLKAMGDSKRDSLESLDGARFDRAYVDAMVGMHQQLLNDLDATLIPSARSEDMKTLLQATRTVVANHLRMAQDLQTKLGATSQR